MHNLEIQDLASIPLQIKMSDVAHYVPDRIKPTLIPASEISDKIDLKKEVQECLIAEHKSFNDYTDSSSPFKYIPLISRDSREFMFPEDKSGSSEAFDYSPIGPLTISRTCLALSSLTSGIITKVPNVLFRILTTYCYRPNCEPMIEECDSTLFHTIKTPLAVPFLIAGTALQSSICLIPCLATNALNLATSQQHDSLNIASSTSMLFFSNGITLQDHLKKLTKINPIISDQESSDSLFNQIFYKFDQSEFPQLQNDNHSRSFRCFLDNPAHYLDDITSGQSYFFQPPLDKQNLTNMLSNISYNTQPIIGRIDIYNQILYAFAFNCLVFNFMNDVKDKFPELIIDDKAFEGFKIKHEININEFKDCIRQYLREDSSLKEYKSKLEIFFNICEEYYGKLDETSTKQQDSSSTEAQVLILGYEVAKDKHHHQKPISVLRDMPNTLFILPQRIMLSEIRGEGASADLVFAR